MKKYKRLLVYFLVLIAVLLAVYNSRHLFSGLNKAEQETKVIKKKKVTVTDTCDIKTTVKYPFLCKAFMTKGKVKSNKKKVKKVKVKKAAIKLPACKLGGIVYNPQNPMAMLEYKGSTKIIKEGDIIDSIRIDKIGKDSVKVIFKGKAFYLKK